MKKLMLTGLAALAIGAGGIMFAPTGSAATGKAVQVAAVQQQATFRVENMTCPLCPVTVKKAMTGVAGVSSVSIDFAAKTARATFDPARTSVAVIAAASTNAGYPARALRN